MASVTALVRPASSPDAYSKEMQSLLDTILIAIPEGYPKRAAAEKLATPGRALLDVKDQGSIRHE